MKKLIFLVSVLALAACSHNGIRNGNTIKIEDGNTEELILEKAVHVVPTRNQLAALENGFIAFIHFGPNTFTAKEWGSGMEDPKIFALKDLDTDQWCETMVEAGMKMVIFTAKHHDGFVLWQSRYTQHGIMSSDFRDGKGDILRDLSESCRKYGLKLGVYLSPADLYQIESPDGLYGNLSEYTMRTIPREVEGRPFACDKKFEFCVDDYNEYFLNQLYELLTEYGPIHELWFDGAHPKSKGGQKYNYAAWKELIHALAPEAVIFGREDIRWCGNEAGQTRESEWNVVPYQDNPDTMNQFHDMTAENLGVREELYKAKYLHYQPAETDVSIRDGWFYRDDVHQRVKSAEEIFDMYERSVGGNAIFLLNIPPNRDGRFSDRDVESLKECGRLIRETYSSDLFADAEIKRKGNDIVVRCPSPVKINRIMLAENVAESGERVEKFAVDAMIDNMWKEIAVSTNIGYKRIVRMDDVVSDRFRIRILETRAKADVISVSAYYMSAGRSELSAVEDLKTVEMDSFEFIPAGNGKNAMLLCKCCDGCIVHGLVYTPRRDSAFLNGSLKAIVKTGNDGINWTDAGILDLGNLINDPCARVHYFDNALKTEYIMLEFSELPQEEILSEDLKFFTE